MNSAGQLTIRGRFAEGNLEDLAVDLQRPSVTRLFINQLPEAVVKTVPYLFTLCAHAQRAAAQAALAVAQGEVPRTADPVELWIEVLHENLWRLLLDWPPALGLPPAREAFIAWRNARHGDDCQSATGNLLRDTLRPLAGQCQALLMAQAEAGLGAREMDVQATAILAPESWLAYWRGEAADMPGLPRPHSIEAVYRLRLAEVEAAAMALAEGLAFPIAAAGQGGWGVGQTRTARGILTHAVHVHEGSVASYRVQAPTDGYFADATALRQLLENRRFSSLDQARQVLNQAILALDPCLPFVVEIQDA